MTSHENSFQLSKFAILGPASLCQHYRSQRHGIRVRRTEETPGRFPISLQHGVDCIYVNGVIESHDGVMESHQQRSKTFHLLRRHQPNTSEPVLVYCHAQPQGHDSCQHDPRLRAQTAPPRRRKWQEYACNAFVVTPRLVLERRRV